jgi:hypothetical protein
MGRAVCSKKPDRPIFGTANPWDENWGKGVGNRHPSGVPWPDRWPIPLQPFPAKRVNLGMIDPAQKEKPVEPTNAQAPSKASNPRQIRKERPAPASQSVGTPDGGGNPGNTGGKKSA